MLGTETKSALAILIAQKELSGTFWNIATVRFRNGLHGIVGHIANAIVYFVPTYSIFPPIHTKKIEYVKTRIVESQ